MGQVIILPVVPLPRAFDPVPNIRLADRTNVADFPVIFCSTDARMARRGRRSLLDDEVGA